MTITLWEVPAPTPTLLPPRPRGVAPLAMPADGEQADAAAAAVLVPVRGAGVDIEGVCSMSVGVEREEVEGVVSEEAGVEVARLLRRASLCVFMNVWCGCVCVLACACVHLCF